MTRDDRVTYSGKGGSIVPLVNSRELPSVRDVADTFFRQIRVILALCILFTIALIAFVVFSPRMYEAEMTILVKNNRVDVVMSPDGGPGVMRQADVSDAQLGTEIQLLSSPEVFRKVVEQCKLAGPSPAERERAVNKLMKRVRVAPVMKSDMIRVRYSSPDPKLSARVLQSIADVYFEQHLQLHSSAGSFEFFQHQAEVYEKQLQDAEAKLVTYQQTSGVASAPAEKDLMLRKLLEQEAALREAQAASAETQKRITNIREQLSGLSPRITTQQRTMPNQYSVERLNTLLAELQNKRTELLSKFKPGDRMIKQVDQQIADTKDAMQRAEKLHATEEATDVNPLRQTLEAELARDQTTADGLTARVDTLAHQNSQYQSELGKVEGILPGEQELVREIKVAEENYLLYSKKREEARIGDAMDQQKIANAALAEPPRVPALAEPKLNMTVAAGFVLGNVLILLGGMVVGHWRRTVQTPWELETFAGTPVLATVAMYPKPKAEIQRRASR